jgi:hypothetical protein
MHLDHSSYAVGFERFVPAADVKGAIIISSTQLSATTQFRLNAWRHDLSALR